MKTQQCVLINTEYAIKEPVEHNHPSTVIKSRDRKVHYFINRRR